MDREIQTQNEQVIRQAFQFWTSGDLDSYYGLFADDAELVEPAGLPYGGTYRGRDAIRAALKDMAAKWKDATVELRQMTSGGDYVITLLDFAGTGIETGMRASYPIAEVFRLRDGKIILCNPIYGDTALALRVLVKQP